MPSDLQRVARGLVDSLDEVPQVVAHLQRTAVRCRENAQVALAASHGRATVAAQQLDAAARACEAAAHYLQMAPPKARAWAERLIGDGSTTVNRPSANSADRNKTTGGSGDVAERDTHGRTKRLTATFEDLDVAEDNEPVLITVARKAFEKFHKSHDNDDDNPQDPLEVEITISESGEIEFEHRNENEDKKRQDRLLQDFEIEVALTESVKALLAAMAASTAQHWNHAVITITTNQAEATFDYPDTLPPPPVVDINLPDTKPPTFNPAFDLRPLDLNFAPGVHDLKGAFKPHELVIARRLAEEGWRVDAREPDHSSGDKNPDTMVRKHRGDEGTLVEFKTPTRNSTATVKRNINDASDQAGEIVIDGRDIGLTDADAWRAYRRAAGQPGKTIADVVHVILGDGRLVSYQKER